MAATKGSKPKRSTKGITGRGTPHAGAPDGDHPMQTLTGDGGRYCGAYARQTGKPCRNRAGFRTDHPGQGPCWLHGGASLRGEASPSYKLGLFSRYKGGPGEHGTVTPEEIDKVEAEIASAVTWAASAEDRARGMIERGEAEEGLKTYLDILEVLKRVADLKERRARMLAQADQGAFVRELIARALPILLPLMQELELTDDQRKRFAARTREVAGTGPASLPAGPG